MTRAQTITKNARPATDSTPASAAWCVICDGDSGGPVCSPDGLVQILTVAPVGVPGAVSLATCTSLASRPASVVHYRSAPTRRYGTKRARRG
jgi:hypothetical protein